MKISDIIASQLPLVSFEFFPPKTDEGMSSLFETISRLKTLSPSFVSITYGAGGSTREKTLGLVAKIKNDLMIETMAHLTCVGHTQTEIRDILLLLKDSGVDNILALRGDPPKGQAQFIRVQNGFAHASELVRFVRSEFSFCVGVAGYPEKHVEAVTFEDDLQHLKNKIQRGADFVITQLFFDNQQYFSFVRKLRSMGITVPVIPGIMPVTDIDQTRRFTGMCGASIPDRLMARLRQVSDNRDRVIGVGIEYATEQCQELLRNGAPGIHFYTLNKSHSTQEIFKNIQSLLHV